MELYLLLPLLLLGGALVASQSSINGALGVKTDILTSAWLTFSIGAAVSLLLVLFFEAPQPETLFSVPKWQLLGAVFGIFSMIVIVYSVPLIGIAAANIAIIAGQLMMGLIIDNFGWLDSSLISIDNKRIAAIGLLSCALYLIYLSHRCHKMTV